MSGSRLLPVGRNEAAVLGELIDVAGERQRHDVGLEAVDHRARLLARAAVRLLDRDVFAGLRLPVLGEGGVELLVELARRIVGDVEKLTACAAPAKPARPSDTPSAIALRRVKVKGGHRMLLSMG